MFKYAIFGGMFNPLHNGHIYIAKKIIQLKIAKHVIFMPNGNHPLKDEDSYSFLMSYEQKCDMIKRAITDYPDFSLSYLDSPEYGVNYTYHLVKRIEREIPREDFTFLIGTDNALTFDLWYENEWLLKNINFTVMTRSVDDSLVKNKLDPRFNLVHIKPYDISSTEIRKKLAKNLDVSDLIPVKIFNK